MHDPPTALDRHLLPIHHLRFAIDALVLRSQGVVPSIIIIGSRSLDRLVFESKMQ
jgi:hypothetical protein